MRALLNQNISFRDAILNSILPASASFRQLIPVALASRKDNLSYFAAPIQINCMIYSFSKDGRDFVASHTAAPSTMADACTSTAVVSQYV